MRPPQPVPGSRRGRRANEALRAAHEPAGALFSGHWLQGSTLAVVWRRYTPVHRAGDGGRPERTASRWLDKQSTRTRSACGGIADSQVYRSPTLSRWVDQRPLAGPAIESRWNRLAVEAQQSTSLSID